MVLSNIAMALSVIGMVLSIIVMVLSIIMKTKSEIRSQDGQMDTTDIGSEPMTYEWRADVKLRSVVRDKATTT